MLSLAFDLSYFVFYVMKTWGCCFDLNNEEKPKGKHCWRAQLFPVPSGVIVFLVDGGVIAAAACSKPKNEHMHWEADSQPSPTPPQTPTPPPHPETAWLDCLQSWSWGAREGKGLVNQGEFIPPLKSLFFFSDLVWSGENYKRLFWRWPDCYRLHQLTCVSPFWECSLACKPTINQAGEASSAHCPLDWESEMQKKAAKPVLLKPVLLDHGQWLSL